MYTINKSTVIDENGKEHILFGIENENVSYTELSSSEEKVAKLCKSCNKLNVSLEELSYIIDDFLSTY